MPGAQWIELSSPGVAGGRSWYAEYSRACLRAEARAARSGLHRVWVHVGTAWRYGSLNLRVAGVEWTIETHRPWAINRFEWVPSAPMLLEAGPVEVGLHSRGDPKRSRRWEVAEMELLPEGEAPWDRGVERAHRHWRTVVWALSLTSLVAFLAHPRPRSGRACEADGRRWLAAAGGFQWALYSAATLLLVRRWAPDMPFWDAWGQVEALVAANARVPWAWLLAPHNDVHWMVFQKATEWWNANYNGWSQADASLWSASLFCSAAALATATLHRCDSRGVGWALLAPPLSLNWMQWESQVWGFGMSWSLFFCFVAGAALALTLSNRWARVGILGALSVFSAWTSAPGLALPILAPFASGYAAWRAGGGARAVFREGALVAVASVVALASSAAVVHLPGAEGPFPLGRVGYLFFTLPAAPLAHWLGYWGLVGLTPDRWPVDDALGKLTLGLAIAGAVAVTAAARDENRRPPAAAVMFVAWGALACLMVAIGRHSTDQTGPASIITHIQSRYLTCGLVVQLGVLAWLGGASRGLAACSRWLVLLVGVVVLLGAHFGNREGVVQVLDRFHAHSEVRDEILNTGDSPHWNRVVWDAEKFRETLPLLRERGWSPFSRKNDD